MYTRILVPVDGSSFSNQILPLARTIARSTGAQLAVYRAVEKSDQLAEVSNALRTLADAHGAQAICAEVRGDVAAAILGEAARVPGTLVAITSHGRSGVMRAVLGSTALNVLRTGGHPIVVYRPQEQPAGSAAAGGPIGRIFIPLDGSPLSESIIPQAVELARGLKARVVVVSVLDPAASSAAGAAGAAPGDVMESNYVQARAAAITQAHGIDAGWEVLHGDPEKAIPEFVRNYPNSMLAMTTRGRSALQSALLGSVTAAALREGGLAVYTRLP
ncbi:universal stress protein [Ramlibacter sp. AN1133]|uniref:universal stress protein n=1 Tax=Ramlibacter sp. AN1133 TaxID=3133429 RepID=UPI0030BBAB0F